MERKGIKWIREKCNDRYPWRLYRKARTSILARAKEKIHPRGKTVWSDGVRLSGRGNKCAYEMIEMPSHYLTDFCQLGILAGVIW